MDMAMGNRLAGSLAGVRADIESADRKIFFDESLPHFLQKPKDILDFRCSHLKQVGEMPSRYDERMVPGHRICVENREGFIILCNYAVLGNPAERTISFHELPFCEHHLLIACDPIFQTRQRNPE